MNQRLFPICLLFAAFPLGLALVLPTACPGQEPASSEPVRGSIVEDRAAKKLIEAGDARFDADESTKAIEIWKSVIERYPRSRHRFLAHMRLGDYFLERDRSYDRARIHYEAASVEDNRDESQRAQATLNMGVCYYHSRMYGKCFQIMRDVIETFPVSPQVNQAYYHIGLGHYQLGHYSRAIAALERVGTALSEDDGDRNKLEAGKRFFIKIEDADLAILGPGDAVSVTCTTSGGDKETLDCFPVGRNVRVVVGSIPSRLGKPTAENGSLEVKGGDEVKVVYTDQHTAKQQINQPVMQAVRVVGDAHVAITDGAFRETLLGVVLGKTVNIQISDADRDRTDKSDSLKAVIEVYRRKTDAEIEAETAALAAANDATATDEETSDDTDLDLEEPQINPLKVVDRVEVMLAEVKPPTPPTANGAVAQETANTSITAESVSPPEKDNAASQGVQTKPPVEDNSIHSGLFQTIVALQKTNAIQMGDSSLQALPGDQVRVTYLDELHSGEGVNEVHAKARCLEGNIGGVRVTRAQISDEELRIQTQLKTADALTRIGNRYKEFGLKAKADDKYRAALTVCEAIMPDVRRTGGRLLEETYVQLWHIYFERDQLSLAAAMCQRLQSEFPSSGFVDDALLQLAGVARKQGDLNRSIGIYNRIVGMKTSQLRGEAQFGIAECYEAMAAEREGAGAAQLRDRAFQEYKKVFDQFPDSGRVGEAVAKMADHYYQQKDYSRAVDTFETVLENHPDAKFLDVILFNYGRCLYRMERKPDARRRFEQLIADFPESPLAADAKKISEALARSGS